MKKQSNVKRFFIVFLPLILLMVFILFNDIRNML